MCVLYVCVFYTEGWIMCVCVRQSPIQGWVSFKKTIFLSFLFCPLLTCACSKVKSVCLAIVVYY